MDAKTQIGQDKDFQIALQHRAFMNVMTSAAYTAPLSFCEIVRSDRLWNCAQIDTFDGFAELEEESMSDGDIARLLQKLLFLDFLRDCQQKNDFTQLKIFLIV
ncbi:MAG: hypothetical protein WBH52_14485 [Pseudomonas aeruginosa]